MEEEKAAAYYDELSRKGEGAARFKQGLGFSSNSSSEPLPSKPKSSSLFSSFVRASSTSDAGADGERPSKHRDPHLLENIQSKLKKRSSGDDDDGGRRSSGSRERRRERRDSEEEERERVRRSRRGDRERSYERETRRWRRSRSRSSSPSSRVSRSRDRDRDRNRDRSRDRDRRSHRREKSHSPQRKGSDSKSAGSVDYSKLIEGYSQMTPAERVKAKMKLQLSQTAAKETTTSISAGWERFDFNKDAPLDDDEEEIEVAEDEISLVKDRGKSFRYSAVEAKREEDVKAAHDLAMFGGAPAAVSSVVPLVSMSAEEREIETKDDNNENQGSNSALISDKVLSMQQGSWRDRARRFQNGSEKLWKQSDGCS